DDRNAGPCKALQIKPGISLRMEVVQVVLVIQVEPARAVLNVSQGHRLCPAKLKAEHNKAIETCRSKSGHAESTAPNCRQGTADGNGHAEAEQWQRRKKDTVRCRAGKQICQQKG